MKIGMIAVMVIGMVMMNGCATNADDMRNVRNIFPGKDIRRIGPNNSMAFIMIDSGKVTIIETRNATNSDITDSITYLVPSKCR